MIRIAILGAGTMGRTHAAAHAALPGVETIGPLPRLALAREFPRLLDDGTIDAVDVCVPTEAHADFVLPALAAGKHVFCETPLAPSADRARAMAEVARRSRRLLQVGLLMRAVAAYRHVKRMAEAGTRGRLVEFATWRRSSYLRPDAPGRKSHYGDVMLELMAFDFDAVNWLMGRPDRLEAAGTDEVEARLGWNDGRSASVAASGLMPLGTPFTSGFRARFESATFEFNCVFEGNGPPRNTFDVPLEDRNPYEVELGHFVDCLRGRADPALLDAERAVEALALADETRLALRESQIRA